MADLPQTELANTPGVGRTSLRFDWAAVEETLLRRLLVAVYRTDGRPDDVALLADRSRDSLIKQAHRSLGRPPQAKHMDAMFDVLREHWLPTFSRDELDWLIWDVQLSLSGPDRNAEPKTKPEKLDFLARRKRTATMKILVRARFIRAHKLQSAVAGGPGGKNGRTGGVVELVGLGTPSRSEPFPHQLAARQRLDDMASSRVRRRSGLLVLPTGAGKTYTLTGWLLQRMYEVPRTRVLWIADQQELVGQAARSFEEHAAHLPADFARRLRVVHGAANPASSLGEADLDVVCVTRQSLLGHQLDASARARVKEFLTRPTVIVVDEAHHAVSPTYRQLLDLMYELSPSTMFVGMTATPWPSAYGMTKRLNELFPVRLAAVQVQDLVKSGVLARPVYHTVDTGETIKVDADELKQMVGRDVPPAVLRRLDRVDRNTAIVNAWTSRRNEWGKTLVFACDIEHADHLGDLFKNEGADVTVVHSRSEVEVSGVLNRRTPGPSILVSVGMLLEGVDVPDARTAFLTRPTTSRIVMRQMVGRVLRGEAAGGESVAHVVDLRDRWDADIDVLAPVELPGPEKVVSEASDGRPHVLPPVLDELSGSPLGEDILRGIERAYSELRGATPLPHTAALTSTTLIGFYELGQVNIPVFDHAKTTWDELIASEMGGRPTGMRSPIDLFGDLPVPRPVKRDVGSVVEFVRAHRAEPLLVTVRSGLSVRRIATEILDLPPLTERVKIEGLRVQYEATLARSAYPSFQAFIEAVQQEILQLSGVSGGGLDPESPRSGSARRRELPRLTQRPSRDLKPVFATTVTRARKVLEEAGEWEYRALLHGDYLPTADWTRLPVASTFAYLGAKDQRKIQREPDHSREPAIAGADDPDLRRLVGVPRLA